MYTFTISKAFAIVAMTSILAGCGMFGGNKDSYPPIGADGETDFARGTKLGTGMGSSSGAQSMGAGIGGSGIGSADFEGLASLQNTFYFDFDSANIRQEFLGDLERHARYLSQNPSARVRLDGHTDERGTREYNMALGERRAASVARILRANGASSSQIETVSYGEERPAMMGASENAWSQNRRVELRYLSR